jgi:N-methylhydantoinase A
VIIPPEPGNFSALGMLLADARLDLSETFVGVLDESTVAALKDAFAELEREAGAALVRDFGAGEVFFEWHAEMRYAGQRHNIKVPISGVADVAGIRQAFDRDYKRRYGHADLKAAAELQALHLSAITRRRRPELRRLPRPSSGRTERAIRDVYFGDAGATETRIYDRTALAPGFHATGPALIEEYGSTTLVAPGDAFAIGELGEIRISRARD